MPSSVKSASLSDDKLEELPHFPRPRQAQIAPDHVQWLQRRNSLSSQQAVFPNGYKSYYGQSNTEYSWNRRGLAHSSSNPVIPSILSSTRSWYTMSAAGTMSAGFPMSHSISSISSISISPQHSTPSTSPRKSSTHSQSHGRYASGPIPDRFRSISTCCTATTLQDVAEVDPCWSPPLRQPPLSADPAIRALSISCEHPEKGPENINLSLTPLTQKLSRTPSSFTSASAIPKRAPVHIIPSPWTSRRLEDAAAAAARNGADHRMRCPSPSRSRYRRYYRDCNRRDPSLYSMSSYSTATNDDVAGAGGSLLPG